MIKIDIIFKSGHTDVWESEKGEFDDYAYDGKCFLFKKDGVYVGIYNMDCIVSIIVTRG